MSSLPFLLILSLIAAIECGFIPSLGFIPGFLCLGSNTSRTGSCQSDEDCISRGDIVDGACSLITTGICCISTLRCDGIATSNNSYFVNPNYPNGTEQAVDCPMRVNLLWNVRFVKIELQVFDVIGTSKNGICSEDYLEITGTNHKYPKICGKNSGQHLYIPVDQTIESTLAMRMVLSSSSYSRKWLIKVIQIPATSPLIPPYGCLQYHTELDGTINSFNFDANNVGSGNIAGLKYSICFAPRFGYCSVRLVTAFFQMNDTSLTRRRRQDEKINIPFEVYQQLLAHSEAYNRLHPEEATTDIAIPDSNVAFISNTCQHQDYVSTSPVQREDIIPIFCGGSQRFTMKLTDSPRYLRVRNIGSTHGKGFSFVYKYLIC